MKKALFLAALILLPLLPLAEAAGPSPRPWSSYTTISEVAVIALAREGTTLAAGLKQAVAAPEGPGTAIPPLPGTEVTNVADTDLAILDHDYGFARNVTVDAATPFGRTHVAVSRDGFAVASLGRDLGTPVAGAPGTAPESRHVEMYYGRIPDGGNWSGTTLYERTVDLGVVSNVIPIGIAMSDDGRRVATLVQDGSRYVLRGYIFSGTSLDSAFELRGPGTPRALATSGDLQRLVVAGQFPEGNMTYGGAFVYPFAPGEPLASYFERSANNTDIRAAASSRDGQTLALGGGDGKLYLFKDARDGALQNGVSLPLGGTALGNLTIAEDGARVASALGTGITLVDTSTLAPAILWNATLGGTNVTGISLNATGGLLLASAAGSGGGVFAYSDLDNAALWTIPGDARGVAVNAAGTRVAYALRAAVGGSTIPRALSMDLVGGGKIAPTQTMTVPGTTTVSVNLRNDGAATERVVFEESTQDITVAAETEIVSVRPGIIKQVNLTVSTQQGLVGTRTFNVTARSLTSGAVDNITLSITPKPTLDVKLFVNDTDVLAEPGQTSEILVQIINNGTGDADVSLTATQTVSGGALWDVSLSETSLTALRGTRASVKVSVTPPADVVNGTSATLQFTLQGVDIFDTARAVFRINPELKVEVNATGVTKFIEPGRKAFYNVTVTNIGSLPREFSLFYNITSSDSRQWGVDMQTQTLRLDPLQKRVIPVSIVAPANALPQERVAVLVVARSIPERENETIAQDNVTLYGIAVEPKLTPSTTPANGIPFLSPLAALAVLLIVTVLHRRRSQ